MTYIKQYQLEINCDRSLFLLLLFANLSSFYNIPYKIQTFSNNLEKFLKSHYIKERKLGYKIKNFKTVIQAIYLSV